MYLNFSKPNCRFKILAPASDASPVEYEYYYEDDYEEPAAPAPVAKKEKAKESNYDIEDLVKAWREYLKEKKSGKLYIW